MAKKKRILVISPGLKGLVFHGGRGESPGSRLEGGFVSSHQFFREAIIYYADGVELVAALIARQHSCGPDCFCWQLRSIPAIEEALLKLGIPKLRTINDAIEKTVAQ